MRLQEEERAVKCMRKDLLHCLHFDDFPPERWKSIRTANTWSGLFGRCAAASWSPGSGGIKLLIKVREAQSVVSMFNEEQYRGRTIEQN